MKPTCASKFAYNQRIDFSSEISCLSILCGLYARKYGKSLEQVMQYSKCIGAV